MIGYVTLGTNDLPKATAFYDALCDEIGASNEGDPGPRGDGFHGAYFRDLDGNKLNFFCFA